jgi:heme O synthase-like polyprenyltransferase
MSKNTPVTQNAPPLLTTQKSMYPYREEDVKTTRYNAIGLMVIGVGLIIAGTALVILGAVFYIQDLIIIGALFVFFGVMMLATGAATLNSVQERQADKAMGRTRNRPLVQGVISRRRGLLQAQLLLGLGFFSLYVGFPTIAPVLAGILAVFLYNFLYTPLKHKTVWAIIPGALCGAIPPYIGWLAAGGSYFSPVIMGVVALFIVWQIPHFWLVVLDNQRDYHSSDIPSMLKMMPARSLGLVSIVWVLSLVTILHIIVLLLVEVPSPGRAIIP